MDSTWTSAHDLGRQYLEQALAGRVTVRTYNMVQPGENAETVMEQAGELRHSDWVPFEELVNNTFAQNAIG